MIYITGDTHSDFKRFNTKSFPEQKTLNKTDYIIICGDFGGVWDNSEREHYWLDWLNAKPFTTLFVSGNHDNFNILSSIPVDIWNGGNVQFIRKSVIHLMRGQVYTIAGKRFFTMGGASSHDIVDGILEPNTPSFKQMRKQLDARNALYRINHVSWWQEELPSDEEYDTAINNLNASGWKVDYIISHCAPTGVANMLGKGIYKADRLTDFFHEVSKRCEFDYWFFGHYHDNISLLGKYHLLYEKIEPLRD